MSRVWGWGGGGALSRAINNNPDVMNWQSSSSSKHAYITCHWLAFRCVYAMQQSGHNKPNQVASRMLTVSLWRWKRQKESFAAFIAVSQSVFVLSGSCTPSDLKPGSMVLVDPSQRSSFISMWLHCSRVSCLISDPHIRFLSVEHTWIINNNWWPAFSSSPSIFLRHPSVVLSTCPTPSAYDWQLWACT